MAELADALDSKSSVVTPRAGSSPAFGTKYEINASELSQKRFCLYNENKDSLISRPVFSVYFVFLFILFFYLFLFFPAFY